MKNALIAVLISAVLLPNGFSAGKGPDIRVVDDKVSIQVEAIPLSRLLKLLDRATGMVSKVPPELANRNVSVRFSNLALDEAVRRIFEGQLLDYVVIQGQGIVVTAASQTISSTEGAPVSFNPAPQPENLSPDDSNPAFPQQVPNQQPIIQTPFGPIQNPRAVPNAQPGAAVPGMMPQFPMGQPPVPGQQPGTVTPDNGLFGNSNGAFGSPNPAFNPNPVNITPGITTAPTSGFPPAQQPANRKP